MIVNTGQRTDIPAFYAKWFSKRLEEGFVYVRNPYYPHLVTKFRLDPSLVDLIAFCTKNPAPMFPYLDKLAPYGQFWYVSITGLGKEYEPRVPEKAKVIEDFKFLSSKVGAASMGWRYTPIILDERYDKAHHIKAFEYIARKLEGYTHLVAYGFLDPYPKLMRLHPELRDCDERTKIELSLAFKEIASRHHMELRLCSKEKYLREYGIDVEGCMRVGDYERALGEKLEVKKKGEARKGYCACYLSNDIGAYSSCLHLCRYCYANGRKEEVKANYATHDDDSPLLLGHLEEGDILKEAKQESFRSKTVSLF